VKGMGFGDPHDDPVIKTTSWPFPVDLFALVKNDNMSLVIVSQNPVGALPQWRVQGRMKNKLSSDVIAHEAYLRDEVG